MEKRRRSTKGALEDIPQKKQRTKDEEKLGKAERRRVKKRNGEAKTEAKESEEESEDEETRNMSIKCSLEPLCRTKEVWQALNRHAFMMGRIACVGEKFANLWTNIVADKCIENKTPFPPLTNTMLERMYHLVSHPSTLFSPYRAKPEATDRREHKPSKKQKATVRKATRKDKKEWKEGKEGKEEKEEKKEKRHASEAVSDEKKVTPQELRKRRQMKLDNAVGTKSIDAIFRQHWQGLRPPKICNPANLTHEILAHRAQYMTNIKQNIVANLWSRTQRWMKLALDDISVNIDSWFPEDELKRIKYEAVRSAMAFVVKGSVPASSSSSSAPWSAQEEKMVYVRWSENIARKVLEFLKWCGIDKMDSTTISKKWWLFIPWLQQIRRDIHNHQVPFVEPLRAKFKKRIRRKKKRVEVDRIAKIPVHSSQSRRKKGLLRQFSLLPQQKSRIPHIQLSNTTIREILRDAPHATEAALAEYKKSTSTQLTTDEVWSALFKLNKFPKSGSRSEFNYHIRTDGYSASILLSKKFKEGGPGGGLDKYVHVNEEKRMLCALKEQEKALLSKQKNMDRWTQTKEAVNRLDKKATLVVLDPGRRSIYSGVIVKPEEKISSDTVYNTIGCSNGWYQHWSGSRMRRNETNRGLHERNLSAIRKGTPSATIPTVDAYKAHLRHLFDYLDRLLVFYSQKKIKRLAFRNYRNRVSTMADMCAHIKAAGPKVAVVCGSASFSSTSSGQAPTPNKKFHKHLSFACPFIPIDEYRTSQICSHCAWQKANLAAGRDRFKLKAPRHLVRTVYDRGKRTITRLPRNSLEEKEEKKESKAIVSQRVVEVHSVRICPVCHTHWNRDVNAARNMLFLAFSSIIPSAFIQPIHPSTKPTAKATRFVSNRCPV